MGRIRSVHPSLATDDEYMALSHAAARILPLLWCECDDQGMFEWKPLTLKARLLPAHNDDMAVLLGELNDRRFVQMVVVDGKSYGLVRNFRRFQRPKKPNATYLLPAEFRTYVGLEEISSEPEPPSNGDSSPPVPHQGGKVSADGGGEDEEGRKNSDADASAALPLDLKRELWRVGKRFLGKHGYSEKQAGTLLGRWRSEFSDGVVIEVLAAAEAAEPSGDVGEYIFGCLRRRRPNGRSDKAKRGPATGYFEGAALLIAEGDGPK